MRKPTDLVTAQQLEAAWSELIGGKTPAELVDELGLDPDQLVTFVRERVREIASRDSAREKAFLLAQLEELLRSAWPKRETDPKWMEICLKIMKERREIVLSPLRGVPARPSTLSESTFPMGRIRSIVKERKERKLAKEAREA